jgi:hypothetical protein
MALIGKKFDGRSLSNFEAVKPAFFSRFPVSDGRPRESANSR